MVTCDWLCFTWQMVLVMEIIVVPSELQRHSCLQSDEMNHVCIPPWPHCSWRLLSSVSGHSPLDHSAYSQDPVGSCSLCLAWIGRFEAWENQKSLFLSCKTIGQQDWAGASCENSLETRAPESLDCETVSKIYIASLFHYPEVTRVFETAMVSDHSKVLHCLLAAQPGQCLLWLTVSCQVK